MKRCGVCCQKYRGAGSMVLAGPKLNRVRACPLCSKRAVAIVPVDVIVQSCKCGQPATTCAACGNVDARKSKARDVSDVLKMLDGLIKVYESRHQSQGSQSDFDAGHVQGLEQARGRIASGSW